MARFLVSVGAALGQGDLTAMERERDIGIIIWYSNDIWYKILEYHHQDVLL
jgi:hypothetical protein